MKKKTNFKRSRRKDETSYKETTLGIIGRSKLIPLEIKGIKKAWDFALKENTKGKIAITPAFLQKVHQVGFGWIFPDRMGKFRTVDVIVSDHKPPRAYLVPQMMKIFCDDLKVRFQYTPNIEDKNFLKKLSELLVWAHHQFLWIHPFTDYNGRIGRLLINIILLNLNLPPIELKVETTKGRSKYVKALKEADKGYYNLLEKIIELAIKESAKEFL